MSERLRSCGRRILLTSSVCLFLSLLPLTGFPTLDNESAAQAATPQVCKRPTGPTSTHEFFYGVIATAKSGVQSQQLQGITPRNQTSRWCLVSYVIFAHERPVGVRMVFLTKGTTRRDEEDVVRFLIGTGLFQRAAVLSKREWLPN